MEEIRLLVVRCGPYRFGIPAGLVRAVVSASDIVPLGLPELPGLTWRDGVLMPVVGLAPILGLSSIGEEVSGHGVLIEAGEDPLCFMVDEALDFVGVRPSAIVPLPTLVVRAIALSGLESAALSEGLLMIVDPILMLGKDRLLELRAAVSKVSAASASARGLQ